MSHEPATNTVAIARFPGILSEDPFHDDPREREALSVFLESVINCVADPDKLFKGKSVFIKPNLNCVITGLNPYAMTDPRLLLALAGVIHGYHPKAILIGEKGGQGKTSRDSYDLLRRHFDIPSYLTLVPIDKDKRVGVPVPGGIVSAELSLPVSYMNAEVVVDVPKMKTHTLTGVSLGIKNLFGLLTDQEKIRHHNEDIHSKLSDLFSVKQPELTLVDGIFALEGQGPLYGKLRKSGIVVAGDNCLETDAVTAFLMGFEPADIAHLSLANRNGLGEIDVDRIRIVGDDPRRLRQCFVKGDLSLRSTGKVKIVKGRDIPSGYLNAISHSLERLAYEGLAAPPMKVYAGEFENVTADDGAVIFGDVTAGSVCFRDQTVIHGHPPVAFALYDALKQRIESAGK